MPKFNTESKKAIELYDGDVTLTFASWNDTSDIQVTLRIDNENATHMNIDPMATSDLKRFLGEAMKTKRDYRSMMRERRRKAKEKKK